MRKIILFSHPLLIAFLLFNLCNDDGIINPLPENHLVLGDTVTVNYGHTLMNMQEHIWLSFDSLLEDSRCPINVLCVWAGNARLGFSFGYLANHYKISLNTFTAFQTDTTLNHYRITLIDVLPVPHTDSSYTANDYKALLVVDKK
ncbi:MAG TPA: hypothetical protein PLP19_22000 [bacterium]|nr:hypothetical protein [bacterium]HPN46173.1 hypothetical protein [bacterium]